MSRQQARLKERLKEETRSGSKCNHCMMEGFKALAKRHNAALVVVDAPIESMPNTEHAKEVYIHYKGDKEATWCGWFMAIPDHCSC